MDFNQFYQSVCEFNNLAGNKNSLEGFKAQMKCLQEEVTETQEAIEDNDITGILDGAVDVIYVAYGILQKLEQLGVDIQGAMQQVATDNTGKFPVDVKVAQSTVLHYNKQNINVSYSLDPKYNKYVIKDENQKVRKPHNFVPTDLSQYVPSYLQKRGLV